MPDILHGDVTSLLVILLFLVIVLALLSTDDYGGKFPPRTFL